MKFQSINTIECQNEILLNNIICNFSISSSTNILPSLKFITIRKLDWITNEVNLYQKNTGIMFGDLLIDSYDPLYILIFDYNIIMFFKLF